MRRPVTAGQSRHPYFVALGAWHADKTPSAEDQLIAHESGATNDDDDDAPSPAPRLTHAELLALLDRIPPEEADAIALTLGDDPPTQEQVSRILGVTQAAISARIRRGIQRLQWLVAEGSLFTSDDVRRDLTGYMRDERVSILATLWETTCVSEVARQHERTQTNARVVIDRTINGELANLVTQHPHLDVYLRGFRALIDHGLGMLWRSASQWGRAAHAGRSAAPRYVRRTDTQE